jgi:adenylosuccinate synthase
LGFSPKKIRDIIGVAKIYDTKSGVDPLFPESLWKDQDLNKILDLGKEYGSTTGRKRIVNWLRLNHLKQAIKISGTNKLIINKCDILQDINKYKIITDDENGPNHIAFIDFDSMKDYIVTQLQEYCEIVFSGNRSSI